MNPRTSPLLRAVVAIMIAFVTFHAGAAHADNIDQLIGQLSDDSDKVRLGATLNLTRLGTVRAIVPLSNRLRNDGSKNVRGAAAVGLAQLVPKLSTGASDRRTAIEALTAAAANDDSEFVKAQAVRALKAIGAPAISTPPPTGGTSAFVNVGPMSSKTGSDDPKFRAMMVKIATKTLGRWPNLPTTFAGSANPTKNALAAKNVQGFYVDGTLNELKVEKTGNSSKVTCKVSMLLASYPDKSVFGFLNGGAGVQASASASDIALAREDCVTAVIEDLIAKKIVPTIKAKASLP
ncbi:MAG: HEAT repeat domain-containing protein [Kofleriaceae bacterium]